jgi:hypothetical protein
VGAGGHDDPPDEKGEGRWEMDEWQASETAPRNVVILVRSALIKVPVRARYVELGAWVEVRQDGTNGGSILAPFEWKNL